MCIISLCVSLPCSYAQQPGNKSFKLLDDNEPFKINCLFKTNDGYIYAGTTNGLYSFDGIRFKKNNFLQAGIKDTVTAIFEDNSNQLWVGFKSGHIAKKVKSNLEYVEMEEGNPKVAITSFIQDKQNNIWFASNGEGIYYFSNKHLYLINTINGLSDLHVRTLALTANGDVLAATDQGINVCRLVNGKIKVNVIGPKNGLPDYYVTAITPTGNNTYWIGLQEKGFCLYDHGSGKITIPTSTLSWTYGQVNDLLVSQKSLWIATEENGLLKQSGIAAPVEVLNTETGIQNKITNLLQDSEGNIWMSTATELTAITGNKLKLYFITAALVLIQILF